MTFERSTAYGLIGALITHPTQYRAATDDSSPAAADFQVNEDPRIWYVLAKHQDCAIGVFTLLPQNAVCYEIHCCLLPVSWGKPAIEAARGAIAWMFEHSPARRIVASIQSGNRLAIALSKHAGMKLYGVNERSFLKGGELRDQILLGVSKWPQQ